MRSRSSIFSNLMKKSGILTSMLFIIGIATAQTVTNLRAFEENGTVLLLYDLHTVGNEKQFYVTAKFSNDKGRTFNLVPSQLINGDVNQLVKLGADRLVKISYPSNAKPNLSELLFKVEAEKVISPEGGGSKKEYYDDEVTVTLLNSKVVQQTVQFTFLLKNRTDKAKVFIIANFVAVDQNNREYRDYKLEAGTAFEVRATSSTPFSLDLKGATNTQIFSKIQFNVSSNLVTFKDVAVSSQ